MTLSVSVLGSEENGEGEDGEEEEGEEGPPQPQPPAQTKSPSKKEKSATAAVRPPSISLQPAEDEEGNTKKEEGGRRRLSRHLLRAPGEGEVANGEGDGEEEEEEEEVFSRHPSRREQELVLGECGGYGGEDFLAATPTTAFGGGGAVTPTTPVLLMGEEGLDMEHGPALLREAASAACRWRRKENV